MKWLRLYYTVVDSVKVRNLPEPCQLDYFLLLCTAAEFRDRSGQNTGETGLTIAEAMWRLRRGPGMAKVDGPNGNVPGNVPIGVPGNIYPSLEQTFPLLAKAGLTHLDKAFRIVLDDWSVYQFASDDVSVRTLKSKQKKRGNSRGNGKGNVPGNGKGNVADTEVLTTSLLANASSAADAARLTREEVWAVGKELLARQGVGPRTAGAYLGHLIKQYGDEQVLGALRRAVVERPADLRGWLKGALRPRNGSSKGAAVAAAIFGGPRDEQPADQPQRDITAEAKRVA